MTMTIKGLARGNVFESIYAMVETHNGHFDRTDKKDMIFSFGNADDKHDCRDAINSLSFNNVLVTKMNGLSIRVSM